MKKKIVFIILIVFCGGNSISQNYKIQKDTITSKIIKDKVIILRLIGDATYKVNMEWLDYFIYKDVVYANPTQSMKLPSPFDKAFFDTIFVSPYVTASKLINVMKLSDYLSKSKIMKFETGLKCIDDRWYYQCIEAEMEFCFIKSNAFYYNDLLESLYNKPYNALYPLNFKRRTAHRTKIPAFIIEKLILLNEKK